jgi:O-antigen ligase
VTASVTRIGQVLGVGPKAALLVVACGWLAVAVVVAVATNRDTLLALVGVGALAIGTMLGLKWPILSLGLFAILIPIEQIVLIDGLGTISRFAGLMFAVTYAIPRLGRLRPQAMPPAAWAYLAWSLVSIGWALDPGRAWDQHVTLIQLFIVAVLVADFVVHQPTIVRSVLWAYSLSALATALIGVEAFVTGGYVTQTRSAVFEGQNPEHFAAVLTPALLFGLHEALVGRRRILGLVIALATTLGVIVTGTRAAWVAIVIVVALFVFPRLTQKGRVASVVLAFAVVAGVAQVPGATQLVTERTATAISTGGAGRTDIWSVAATIYASAPFLGVGYANFPIAYTPQMARASNVSSWSNIEGRGAHNVAILTLVELGPIGLVLLAAFLGPLVLRRGWGSEAVTIQASVAALLTQALFVDMLSNRKPIWLMIGFAAGLAYVARRERAWAHDPLDVVGAGDARAAPLPGPHPFARGQPPRDPPAVARFP